MLAHGCWFSGLLCCMPSHVAARLCHICASFSRFFVVKHSYHTLNTCTIRCFIFSAAHTMAPSASFFNFCVAPSRPVSLTFFFLSFLCFFFRLRCNTVLSYFCSFSGFRNAHSRHYVLLSVLLFQALCSMWRMRLVTLSLWASLSVFIKAVTFVTFLFCASFSRFFV